jgi:thioredoxin reductase
VTRVERVDAGGFRVARLDGPPVEARRLLVTTGLADELPDVPGLAERWGHEVLHCPYCHGWEVRDHAIAVLATSPLSVHQALLWRQWTADLTLVLHAAPPPSDEEAAQLTALGVEVIAGPAAAVEVAEDRVTGLRLGDGRLVDCQEVVVMPRVTARAGLLVELGLPIADHLVGGEAIGTRVDADPTGATAVAGVWVAGNIADPTESVVGAAAAGLRVAHAVNLDLITEDARAAVVARRDPVPATARSARGAPDG